MGISDDREAEDRAANMLRSRRAEDLAERVEALEAAFRLIHGQNPMEFMADVRASDAKARGQG